MLTKSLRRLSGTRRVKSTLIVPPLSTLSVPTQLLLHKLGSELNPCAGHKLTVTVSITQAIVRSSCVCSETRGCGGNRAVPLRGTAVQRGLQFHRLCSARLHRGLCPRSWLGACHHPLPIVSNANWCGRAHTGGRIALTFAQWDSEEGYTANVCHTHTH